MTSKMPMSKDLRATVYVRVATAMQADGGGTHLQVQERTCREKAAELGAEVVAVHCDGGWSGAEYARRPGLQAALRDIEEGRANLLLCARMDRAARTLDVLRAIQRRLVAAHARLVCADSQDGSDNASWALQDTVFVLHEEEHGTHE